MKSRNDRQKIALIHIFLSSLMHFLSSWITGTKKNKGSSASAIARDDTNKILYHLITRWSLYHLITCSLWSLYHLIIRSLYHLITRSLWSLYHLITRSLWSLQNCDSSASRALKKHLSSYMFLVKI